MQFTPEIVRGWVREGEGKRLEFKQGLPADAKVARTLCAFANTRGGLLLIGITDRGSVFGVEKPREVTEKLRVIAREWVRPTVEPLIASVRLEEGTVVCCSIPLSPDRPHRALTKGGEEHVVIRAGSSNRRAAGATLAALERPSRSKSGLPELERRVLDWVTQRSCRNPRPGGDATVKGFAQAMNVGVQRAKRAFVHLEREGLLVAHGRGAHRTYCTV